MRIKLLLACPLLGLFVLTNACSLEPPRHTAQYSAAAASAPQRKAVSIAQQMLGKPYRYGGNTPKGFDCSGLVHYSYSKAGYPISRDSKSQIAQTITIDPRELRPGDLVFFDIGGSTTHIGIYSGNGQFIHAPSSGKRVSYASLKDTYWREHFVRAGRLK
ncbi:MAG TPA: C40 family peptidase [Gammaproteobacteria bacterium]